MSRREYTGVMEGLLHKCSGCIWSLAHTSQGSDHQEMYYNVSEKALDEESEQLSLSLSV